MTPTPEQRLIIGYPLAPLRVEAGAGTGKTATLAWRVVALIHGGIAPEEILGLTFTNKAADELADRIRGETGPGREVEVHTYHGFAAHVVQEFGPLAGIERDFRVITPTFGRQLLADQLTVGTYDELDLTFPRGVVARLVKLESELSDHLLFAADIVREAEPQDPWPARLELASVLVAYEDAKHERGLLDYGDLIRVAYHIVTDQPEIATRIRARYTAVLLDEYQDTNPAQRELLRKLFGHGFPVTAVGDPNQTIYEWRGASRENFQAFPVHFPQTDGTQAETLPLSLNRRSGSRILAVANRVAERLGSHTRLRPRPRSGPGHVEARWHRTAADEANWIAEEVTRLGSQENLEWRDIAVLFRKNKDIAIVRDHLADHDIPVEVANLGGLLSIPEVVELHSWLRLLRDPLDGVAVARILLGSRFRLGLADLRPLAEWARARDGEPVSDPEWDTPAHSLIEAAEELDSLEIRAEARPLIDEFLRLYRHLLAAAQGTSLVELCRQILDTISAWDEIEAMPPSARLSARLNLYRFLDLAEDWSPIEGRPSLAAFLDHLDLMQEEEAEDLDPARLSNENAVALLTIHRAKGLEWEAVFLPALYHRNFPSQPRLHADPFRFPQILPYELRLDREAMPAISAGMSQKLRNEILGLRHAEQEWRTAYVAVTRARSRLYASGAWWVGSPAPLKEPVEQSDLFRLIVSDEPSPADHPGPRPDRIRAESVLGAPDPVFPEGWQSGLRQTLEDSTWPARRAAELRVGDLFSESRLHFEDMVASVQEEPVLQVDRVETSATSLVTYAGCPRRYFWSEVDRLPRRSSGAARRGASVHRQIELHNLGAVPFEELGPGLYDIPDEGGTGADPFEAFMSSRFASERPRWVETPFELVLPNQARIRGRIDAIYGEEEIEVVDFKTGSPPPRPEAGVQLETYGLAVVESQLATPPIKVTFAFLGDEVTEVSDSVDEKWLTRARGHLVELTDGIAREEFEATPSDLCPSCDFVRFCPPGRSWLAAQVVAQQS